jgi:mRNA interferase MazF
LISTSGCPRVARPAFVIQAVVASAQRILDAEPSVVFVVPLTSTLRDFHSEISIEPDDHNGLAALSAAQCQHIRTVSRGRIASTRGNVGVAVLAQIRETIAVLLDITI